jgi:hypothetical protein
MEKIQSKDFEKWFQEKFPSLNFNRLDTLRLKNFKKLFENESRTKEYHRKWEKQHHQRKVER